MASTGASTARRYPLRDRLPLLFARGHAERTFARFLRQTRRTREVQRALLQQRLWSQRDSAFGQDHGFAGIRNYADFRQRVPVNDYESLRPYVERVKAGEITALFRAGTRVHMFAKTSGTTDTPKYIPVTDAFLREYRRGWNAFGIKVIADHDCFLRPIVQVVSPMDEEHTSAGIPCGAITGLMAATQKRLVRRYYIVPREIAYIPDAAARYYSVMRFAITGDVGFLITANPATLLKLARVIDQRPDRIVRDLHDGTLAADLPIPTSLRDALEARLQPDPQAARRLETIAQQTGRLRPRDYWQLDFLANWTGGSMGLYLRDFPEFFGDTPVRDIGLLASEGRISIPIADGTASGVLSIEDHFFEFIPAEEYGQEDPTILEATQLEADRDYFVLITTSAGFYRYDLGDCVRVTGFCHAAPMIEFLHKGAHTSSLAGEKLTERQVVLAFDQASHQAQVATRLFVLIPRWAETPFYGLHLEGDDVVDGARAEALAAAVDERLQQINTEYAGKRQSGRLGPIAANLLPAGFLVRRDQAESTRHRAANEQFKHRYLMREIGADAGFPGAPTGPA